MRMKKTPLAAELKRTGLRALLWTLPLTLQSCFIVTAFKWTFGIAVVAGVLWVVFLIYEKISFEIGYLKSKKAIKARKAAVEAEMTKGLSGKNFQAYVYSNFALACLPAEHSVRVGYYDENKLVQKELTDVDVEKSLEVFTEANDFTRLCIYDRKRQTLHFAIYSKELGELDFESEVLPLGDNENDLEIELEYKSQKVTNVSAGKVIRWDNDGKKSVFLIPPAKKGEAEVKDFGSDIHVVYPSKGMAAVGTHVNGRAEVFTYQATRKAPTEKMQFLFLRDHVVAVNNQTAQHLEILRPGKAPEIIPVPYAADEWAALNADYPYFIAPQNLSIDSNFIHVFFFDAEKKALFIFKDKQKEVLADYDKIELLGESMHEVKEHKYYKHVGSDTEVSHSVGKILFDHGTTTVTTTHHYEQRAYHFDGGTKELRFTIKLKHNINYSETLVYYPSKERLNLGLFYKHANIRPRFYDYTHTSTY